MEQAREFVLYHKKEQYCFVMLTKDINEFFADCYERKKDYDIQVWSGLQPKEQLLAKWEKKNKQFKYFDKLFHDDRFGEQRPEIISYTRCIYSKKTDYLPKQQAEARAHRKHKGFYSYNFTRYVHTKSKIEIFCPIHGVFYANMNNHIHHGTGCPACAKNGFDHTKPADLYVVLDPLNDMPKIGITNRSVDLRFSKKFSSRLKVISVKRYETGADAYREEQRILKTNAQYRQRNDKVSKKDGPTEFFKKEFMVDCYPYLGIDWD